MNSIIPVTPGRISSIIRITEPYLLGDKPRHTMPEKIKARFITKTGKIWTACDNRSGDCWVEDFATAEEAIRWLKYA